MAATYAQRKALGDYGERLAARELESRGLVVLDRNWRCPEGELDIVAREGSVLVGCEVKTRRGTRFGSPVEAITQAKADRVFRLLAAWARAHTTPMSGGARVDVVSVVLGTGSGTLVTHYRGVS